MDNKNCFTYFIKWTSLNKSYYGRRTAKNCSPKDLMTTYFTSSKLVKQLIKEQGLPDIVQIRKEFGTDHNACTLHENKVLRRLNVTKKDFWLNKTNGDKKFDTTGIVPYNKGVKMSEEFVIKCSKPKTDSSKMGKYARTEESKNKHKDSWIKKMEEGYSVSKESRIRMSMAQSGENNAMYGVKRTEEWKKQHSLMFKGKVTCYDKQFNKIVRIDKNDFHNNKDRYFGMRTKETKIFLNNQLNK